MYFFLYCDCPHVNAGLKGRKNQDFAKCTRFLSILRVDFELGILLGNWHKTWHSPNNCHFTQNFFRTENHHKQTINNTHTHTHTMTTK